MEKHGQYILLADDDLDDLSLLSEVLQNVDGTYVLVQANNGEEALHKLDQMKATDNLPCLIVLDINMPKMDGKQTLVAIQSDPELSSIPIVIFTTSSSEVDRMYFQMKKVEMITKPFDYQSLYNVATKMLGYCKS